MAVVGILGQTGGVAKVERGQLSGAAAYTNYTFSNFKKIRSFGMQSAVSTPATIYPLATPDDGATWYEGSNSSAASLPVTRNASSMTRNIGIESITGNVVRLYSYDGDGAAQNFRYVVVGE